MIVLQHGCDFLSNGERDLAFGFAGHRLALWSNTSMALFGLCLGCVGLSVGPCVGKVLLFDGQKCWARVGHCWVIC